MKIGLFGKTMTSESAIYLQQLIDKIFNVGLKPVFFQPYLEIINQKIVLRNDVETFETHEELKAKADILFSIGGDGTLLDTIVYLRNSGIPVLGINLGRLGFLSSVSPEEIIAAVDMIRSGNFQTDQRILLQILMPEGLFGEINFALNEFSITKTDHNSLAVVEVHVDDKFLNTYWADGLLVATPTGSTAYSLSCYGPIIAPGSQNFVITPIASHNLTVRPIVIHADSTIKLKVGGRNRNYQAGLDSRFKIIGNSTEILLKRADFKINLIQLPGKHFYKTIREKLLWGKDQRN
jgi:NAD+ kinase